MTTRDGLGEVSDHSRSMAMTAGSTLSATAGPPAISNATSTIAKRRTRISPDETPRGIYKAADSPPRCTRPQVLGPRHFVGKRDLFASPPTHMRRQRIDDGSDSVFWAGGTRLSCLLRPRWAISRRHTGPEVPRCQRTLRSLTIPTLPRKTGAFDPGCYHFATKLGASALLPIERRTLHP